MKHEITLSKCFTEIHPLTGKSVSDMTLTVKYDYEEESVTKVVSIISYSYASKASVNLTYIFNDNFPNDLDSMIESVDWDELAQEHLKDMEDEMETMESLHKFCDRGC